LKSKYPGMKSFQQDWARYVTRSAYWHGMVPMYWDIGSTNGLFNRTTGARQDPELIKTIVDAIK